MTLLSLEFYHPTKLAFSVAQFLGSRSEAVGTDVVKRESFSSVMTLEKDFLLTTTNVYTG